MRLCSYRRLCWFLYKQRAVYCFFLGRYSDLNSVRNHYHISRLDWTIFSAILKFQIKMLFQKEQLSTITTILKNNLFRYFVLSVLVKNSCILNSVCNMDYHYVSVSKWNFSIIWLGFIHLFITLQLGRDLPYSTVRIYIKLFLSYL